MSAAHNRPDAQEPGTCLGDRKGPQPTAVIEAEWKLVGPDVVVLKPI